MNTVNAAPAPDLAHCPDSTVHLLPFGAGSSEELQREVAGALRTQCSFAELVDRTWESVAERPSCTHRRIILARNADHFRRIVTTAEEEWSYQAVVQSGRSLVMMISGLGERPTTAGDSLYSTHRLFRSEIDSLSDQLDAEFRVDPRDHLGRSPNGGYDESFRAMFKRQPTPADRDPAQTRLDQPTQFVLAYALARTWLDAGIRPCALVGHSLGEYTAASLAGLFDPRESARLVARRAELISALPGGSMLAVAAAEESVRPLIGELSVAAVNSPGVTVVAGSSAAVRRAARRFDEEGLLYRHIEVSHPFHTRLLEPVKDRLRQHVEAANRQEPTIRWASTVTGTWLRPGQATHPDYWTRHMCERVRFLDATRAVLRLPSPVLLEVGPGRSLATLATHTSLSVSGSVTPAFASFEPSPGWHCDTTSWLFTLGRLWAEGESVEWKRVRGMMSPREARR